MYALNIEKSIRFPIKFRILLLLKQTDYSDDKANEKCYPIVSNRDSVRSKKLHIFRRVPR